MQLSIKSPREFINPLLSKRAIDGNSLGKFKQQLNELFVRISRVVYSLFDKSTFEVSHKELSCSTTYGV